MTAIPMTWVFASGIVSIVVVAVGVVYWRRDGWPLLALMGAGLLLPGILLLPGGATIIRTFLVFHLAATAIIGYTGLRATSLRFGPWAACVGGVVTALLVFLLYGGSCERMFGLERSAWLHKGTWLMWALPLSLAAALLVAVVAWVIRLASDREGGTTVTTAGEEERRAVLKMMGEGKISSREARELLNAMQGSQPSGDSLPMSRATLATIIGALLVVIAFMLPWTRVQMAGVTGYQAGHHVGFLGWLILALGLLPAVLCSIPALDKHLRQGLLRLVFSATGMAFAVSLLVKFGSSMRIGVVVLIIGFLIQLISALAESGLLDARRGTPRAVTEMFQDFTSRLREEASRKKHEEEKEET